MTTSMQQTHGKGLRVEKEKIIYFLNMIKAKANRLTMTKEIGAITINIRCFHWRQPNSGGILVRWNNL